MAAAPMLFSLTSLEGCTVIREIIEERIPELRTGPLLAQLNIAGLTLAGILTILIASTGWGKTTVIFVSILVLQHLLKYLKPQIPKPPQCPPLIELGKAHVSPSIQYKCNT